MALPPGFTMLMALICPRGWHGHTPSAPWPQHGGTSSAVGTGSEACWVPITDAPQDMHLY